MQLQIYCFFDEKANCLKFRHLFLTKSQISKKKKRKKSPFIPHQQRTHLFPYKALIINY